MAGVATVVIDRPELANALDGAICRRLSDDVAGAAAGGARAIVVTGAGRHFCAGADLSQVRNPAFLRALRALLDAIAAVPVVVIAAVHGAALGAGTMVAMACDLRVVDPTARFGIPAAKLGLMVDAATVEELVAVAGPGAARAMLLGAEEVDAAAALRCGLAHRSGDLASAQAWAADIAALAPLAVAGHKLALNRLALHRSPEDPVVSEALRRAWSSRDADEGVAAFGQRRPPQFEGT